MSYSRTPYPAWVRALVLLFLSTSWTLERPAQATVDEIIRGTVNDDLIQPIPGAIVTLRDSRGEIAREEKSAPDGTFTMAGLALGEYDIEAKADGHITAHQHLRVGSGEAATAELYCARPDARAIIVEEARVAPPTKASGSVSTLTRESLKVLPKGEDLSITEVVSTQAGFVQDAFGNVYVRGNHANVQYQIDGIPIPDSVGNLFAQAIPVRLIDSVEILTGGMPAEFGNRLAAVVNIASRSGGVAPDGLVQLRYGSFQTIEPSAYYSRSVGRFSFFVGGSYIRRSAPWIRRSDAHPARRWDDRAGVFSRRLETEPERSLRGISAATRITSSRFQTTQPAYRSIPLRPSYVRTVHEFGNSPPAFRPHDTDATETENEVFVAASWVARVESRRLRSRA